MLALDLAAAIVALGMLVGGLAALRWFYRKSQVDDLRLRGQDNSAAVARRRWLTCQLCGVGVDPARDLYHIDLGWQHAACPEQTKKEETPCKI